MACARGCCVDQRSHYRSLVFGVSETVQAASDRKFADDRHAYKRLRDEGLQPRSIRGSALLEKTAESRWEVETGQRLDPKLGKRVDDTVVQIAGAS